MKVHVKWLTHEQDNETNKKEQQQTANISEIKSEKK